MMQHCEWCEPDEDDDEPVLAATEPSVQVPVSLIDQAKRLAGQLESNADAHQETEGTERRRAAAMIRALLSQSSPNAEDRNAWDAAVQAKRAEQRAKGYTAQHDREHGVEHLLLWAQDYASRGRHLDAAALVEAAREVVFWQRTAKSDYDLIEDQLREAGLSTKTLPAAPPSIADMVPGTTFVGSLFSGIDCEGLVLRFHVIARERLQDDRGNRWTPEVIDPSTIRDVRKPKQ